MRHQDVNSTRKFLPHWKYLFPWVEVKDGECNEETIEKLYCRECSAAGLKNNFALGKIRPAKGWKKEYLRYHTNLSDYSQIAPQVTAIAKTASSMFKVPKTSASERETLGLLINIHFLATNGLLMNKGAPIYSLVDFHILFYDKEPVMIWKRYHLSLQQPALGCLRPIGVPTALGNLCMLLMQLQRVKMLLNCKRQGIFLYY